MEELLLPVVNSLADRRFSASFPAGIDGGGLSGTTCGMLLFILSNFLFLGILIGRERGWFSVAFGRAFLGGGMGTGLFGGRSTGFGLITLRLLVTLISVDKLASDCSRGRTITTPSTLPACSEFSFS